MGIPFPYVTTRSYCSAILYDRVVALSNRKNRHARDAEARFEEEAFFVTRWSKPNKILQTPKTTNLPSPSLQRDFRKQARRKPRLGSAPKSAESESLCSAKPLQSGTARRTEQIEDEFPAIKITRTAAFIERSALRRGRTL